MHAYGLIILLVLNQALNLVLDPKEIHCDVYIDTNIECVQYGIAAKFRILLLRGKRKEYEKSIRQ